MPVKTVDLSNSEHNDKHKAIFDAFDTLDLGEKMLLIDSTDPTHLFNKLDEERETKLDWRYVEEGPDLWKVSVEKRYLSFI
ncbi:DUF2249 domain-containing protein [Proteiniborus sp. MB09-C3]|uniref:DUF2249 domain-containing protein n=1 Tax=Proteiniborus sp. MB09-C3 TaxID=3050072 RepID=UPI002555163F|nr:DUF2249 domain-containing protein [Proteiniborus sp. MB09-C3]WIV13396.1 DUF2249 domain-containing protein [Proteiniborus sp. MB09-C3]